MNKERLKLLLLKSIDHISGFEDDLEDEAFKEFIMDILDMTEEEWNELGFADFEGKW